MTSNSDLRTTKEWYEEDYRERGLAAQRLYPNEELLRFLGRNYFALAPADRGALQMLEVGCGSCSNLWMVAREGFRAYGIDLSDVSLELGAAMLRRWQVSAELTSASMTDLPFADGSFDAVLDVFSSYCLDVISFERYLDEARRVLRPGGRLFVYTPSVDSDAFKNHSPAALLDARTLDGIRREDSPFYGNFYPFRFTLGDELVRQLADRGFEVDSIESITRTYRRGAERFQHLSVDARVL